MSSGGKKPKYQGLPPIQLVVRDHEGWRLYQQHPKTGNLKQQTPNKKCNDCDIVFSPDGIYFAVLLESGIEIYNSSSGNLVSFLNQPCVRTAYFSPLNTYIISYHHRTNEDKHGNVLIWHWSSNNIVYQFFVNEWNKKIKPFQFSDDEIIAARITNNSFIILDAKHLNYSSANILGLMKIPNISQISIAPMANNNNDYLLAIFALPTKSKTKAATVTLYTFSLQMALKKSNAFTKGSQRAFFNVDSCELKWNSRGCTLLAITISDVDIHGLSYYGHQTLYLLHSRKNHSMIIPVANQGKLQEVQWHPSGLEFIVIDDHPQKMTVYDYNGRETILFGTKIRNKVRYSMDGRFMWCGGFGNLTGEMSFYDWGQPRKSLQNLRTQNADEMGKIELGFAKDSACRYFEYSPDSSTFLAASLYPFMTVDTGFKLYKYNGRLLMTWKESERLYQVQYRPSLLGVYPVREPSPNAVSKKKVATKAYVPPHLRNKMQSMQAHQQKKLGFKKRKRKSRVKNLQANVCEEKKVEVDVCQAKSDGKVDDGKKKKRRRKRKRKNKEDDNVNNNKPGLSNNDNQRWARGKKYQS